MFRKGGSANSGIMDGLDRKGYDNGGRIEPFNRYTADTFGSPYYDNEAVMENLRRFQKLGMGNPYRELGGKAGFDSIGDYIFRPAEKDLFKSIYEAAPIVKKEKAAKEAIEKEVELRPYKKYFSSDEGVNYKAEVEEGDGGINSISTNDARAIIADKKSMLSDRAKQFAELLSPGAQKRAIYDSLAAASEAFGKGTGNTGQTIANAITAAAKGMGGAKDLADKVSLLTLQGEIQKDIEKSKTVRKSNYEFLYDKLTSPDPKDQDFARSILKQDKDLGDFVEQHGTDKGYRLFVGRNFPDIKDTFAGDETSLKKLKTEELEDGKYYLGPPADEFIIIQGGKITKREPGLV